MSKREREDDQNQGQTINRIDENGHKPNEADEIAPKHISIEELYAANLQFKNEIIAAIMESQRVQATSIDEIKKGQDNSNAELTTKLQKANSELQNIKKEMSEMSEKMNRMEAKMSITRPKIFKLDVDCMQEIFDYLSIEDIHSIAQTCIRMERIAIDYFKTNFTTVQPVCQSDDSEYKRKTIELKNINKFKEFVQNLEIYDLVDDEMYRSIGLRCKSLKKILFDKLQLNAIKIQYLKPILSKVEMIEFVNSSIKPSDEFYNSFLKFCPKLKELYIVNKTIVEIGQPIIGTSNEWLLRSYPTLEHLKLSFQVNYEIPELATFFERNPNLQGLTILGETFLNNINVMLQSKTKLKMLAVDAWFCSEADTNSIRRYLQQLYSQGFYERLEYCYGLGRDNITSDFPALEQIYCQYSVAHDWNSLTNLKILSLNFSNSTVFPLPFDLQSAAKSLVNLEELGFDRIDSKILESFIENARKLKMVQTDWLHEPESINLYELNKKREKLEGAKKVTIYLNEIAYLATKWSNKATNFKMIELKRIESGN